MGRDIAVVETGKFSSFMLVSDMTLNLNVRLTPFVELVNKVPSSLHLVASVRGPSMLRRITKKQPTWKKCGYEHKLVMKNCSSYNFSNKDSKAPMKLDTHSAVFSAFELTNYVFNLGDFLDFTLSKDNQDVKDFTVSIFDKLRVDQEAPNYITTTTPKPRTDDKKADNPEFGQISNVEPLYETVRASSISSSQVKTLIETLGGGNDSESSVQTSVKQWAVMEDNKLDNFLEILDKTDLGHISTEIKNNLHQCIF